MADEPPTRSSDRAPADGRRASLTPPGDAVGAPRWVIGFGIVAVVLVLAFVVLHLVGGGFRGHG